MNMLNEMLVQLEIDKKAMRKDRLHLKQTKMSASLYRDAIKYNWCREVINEAFKLVEVCARNDWGDDTTVDDFSEPGFLIIKNKRMEERI